MAGRARSWVVGVVDLLRCFARANRGVTAGVIVAGVVSGALFPVFIVATGWLVGAARPHGSWGLPLALVVVIFFAERVLDPVLEGLGQALWRQVDESLDRRLMTALGGPAGLAQVESSAVRDRVVRAQGVLTDLTPGQAAYYLGRVVALEVQGAGALLIFAVYRWWLAAVLVAAYAVAFRISRRHWHEVTMVLYGGAERLRPAYYLRSVALTPAMGKET